MRAYTSEHRHNIKNISAIKNQNLARTLLESMQELAAQNNNMAVRGLPILNLNPTAADVDCPILNAAFGYWQDNRRGEDPPTTKLIDPAALRPALGWFALVDLVDGGEDFTYRLFGSEIAWRFDLDLTGQRVSAIAPPFGRFLLAAYRACIAARGPLLAQCAFNDPVADQIRSLLLPWIDDDGAIARIMSVVSVRDRRAASRTPPHSRLVRLRD